jgi:serine/threonine-protein kinase RsbW/stage II sporulation protein AB (anti-sigma F factor)
MADRLTLSQPARPESVGLLRRELVTYARANGASEETCQAVALAVSEALTNAVVHGYADRAPGELIVEAWQDEDGYLVVVVCDEGPGIRPRMDSPGLGLGLSLMAQVAAEVRVANRSQSPGAMVLLRFALKDSETETSLSA